MIKIRVKGSTDPSQTLTVNEGSPLITDSKYEIAPSELPSSPAPTPPKTTPDKFRYIPPADSEYDKEATNYYDQFKMPDPVAIREEKRKAAQAMVDTINQDFYNRILPAENAAGEDRLGRTRAIAARSGTLTSDFGGAALSTTEKGNKDIIAAREAERASMVANIFDKFDARADEEITNKTNLALKGEEARLSYLKNKTDEARTDFKAIASSGVLKSLDDLEADDYQMLLKQTGYSDLALESIFNASKTKAAQIDYKTEKLNNGKILFYGLNPTTGELVQKTFDYNVPPEFDLTMTTDGTPLLFNKTTGEVKLAEGFKEEQFKKEPTISEKYGSGIIGEYNYYVDQEKAAMRKPISFNDYQTADANRKKSNTNIYNINSPESKNDMAGIQADIEAIRGADKKLDPTKYPQIRERVATDSPNLLDWFDKTYDPKIVFDPKNPAAQAYFKSGTQMTAGADSKLTRENIAKLYNLSDNDTKTGFLGTGKTNKQKLDDIIFIVDQYKSVGYSDDEILKLLKEE
ncbi:MAG: hypothetical protein WC619_01805 [Patescibacteria group bacterium]